MTDAELAAIGTLRRRLWHNCGYRPIAVLSHTDPDPKKAGKAPLDTGWQKAAQQDPPEVVRYTKALGITANTGIWCGGLRLFDCDIDDCALANDAEGLIIKHLGAAPTRRRDNSNRFAMLYRAAEGQPGKRSIAGASHSEACGCKVEVLGHGQQFVAYGTHVSGGALYWSGPEPLDMPADKLPVVTEAQVTAVLQALALLIDAVPPGKPRERRPRVPANGADHDTSPGAPLTGDTFVTRVNSAALRDLHAWVKDVFPEADYQEGTGAYRVSPEHRGRPDLEEDISLHPDGIQDFGEEHGMTPIAVVVAHGGKADDDSAALWLCEKIGIDPTQLGWQSPAALQAQLEAGPGWPPPPRSNGKAQEEHLSDAQPPPPSSGEAEAARRATGPNRAPDDEDGPPAEWNTDTGPDGETEPPPRQSEDEAFVLPIEFSENSLSYLFSERHQHHLVFVHGWGKWLRYHAGRWHEDHTVRVYDAARAICAEQGERALHTLPPKSATKVAAIINKAGCVAAIERLARHHEPQTRDLELFNADQGLISGPSQHSKLQRKRKE